MCGYFVFDLIQFDGHIFSIGLKICANFSTQDAGEMNEMTIRMTCFSRLRGMQKKKQCSPENIISFQNGIVLDVLAPGEGNWRWVCTGS